MTQPPFERPVEQRPGGDRATPSLTEPELARRLAASFAAEGVDPSYLRFVAEHVHEPDDTWRWCCGSSCDPCVDRLARLVDTARCVLGVSSPTA